MSYILSYTSVAYTKKHSGTRFGGSSRFRVVEDELVEISKTQKPHENKQRRNQVEDLSKESPSKESSEVKAVDSEEPEFSN
ncbi:MAG: hypothetical protein KAR19_13535 [Bacteroidales bacterium]|nr:hypothetical protein [Bacteroidales bacterium]